MRNPDGYPRLQVGLYADAVAARSAMTRADIERVSRLRGWQSVPDNTKEHEVRRELSVAGLLGEKGPLAAAKAFYIDSIRLLKAELTTFKKKRPALPWHAG